uniref:Uncharacterized protein n=1 Tax=Ditylenchus dipsaci TaxID=166011 RepID=A0A915E0R0_9BILA
MRICEERRELKDVCPDLVSFLYKNGGLTFQSSVELSNKLLGRIVPEKRLFEACTYKPCLFERCSRIVAEEELQDKLLHELALADLTDVVVSVSPDYCAVLDGLAASSIVILDGKQEVGCALRSLSMADVEVNELFGGLLLVSFLRSTQAPLIDESCVMLEKISTSTPVALFLFKNTNQPSNAGSLVGEMCRCGLRFSDVIMGSEFDELYKLLDSEEAISVVAQLSAENDASFVDFLLDSILRNIESFKKIFLMVTNPEQKKRVDLKNEHVSILSQNEHVSILSQDEHVSILSQDEHVSILSQDL